MEQQRKMDIHNLSVSKEVITTLEGKRVTRNVISLNEKIVTYEEAIAILDANPSPMNNMMRMDLDMKFAK